MCAYGCVRSVQDFFMVIQLCFNIAYYNIPISHSLLRITIILTINPFINNLLLQLCNKESHHNITGCESDVQDLKKLTPGHFTKQNFFLWI